MQIRAVTWDAFGTLVHHGMETIEGAAADIAHDLALPVSPEEFLERWQERYFALLRGEFRTIAEANAISLAQAAASFGHEVDVSAYIQRMESQWFRLEPYPETARVLKELRDLPMAVVSNADEEVLRAVLRRGNISIGPVISSERARAYKPDSRIFTAALRELDVPASEVLHVGDSFEADVRGASMAGMRTAWVNRGGLARDVGLDPDVEIGRLDELLAVLGR